jgi:hypothetical protein
MNNSKQNIYSSEGTTNNPPARYPGQLGTRSGQAKNRYPASLPLPTQEYDIEDYNIDEFISSDLFLGTDIVSSNSNASIETYTLNVHEHLNIAAGQVSNHGSNGLNFGLHSSEENYDNNGLLPQQIDLEGSDNPWIPPPLYGEPPTAKTIPSEVPSFSPKYPATVFPSNSPHTGTTIMQSPSSPLDLRQLSQQGSETVFGNNNSSQVIYDPPIVSGPADLALARKGDRMYLDLFSQSAPIHNHMSKVAASNPPTTLSVSANCSARTRNTTSIPRKRKVATKRKPKLPTAHGVQNHAEEPEPGKRCIRCKVKRLAVCAYFIAAFYKIDSLWVIHSALAMEFAKIAVTRRIAASD